MRPGPRLLICIAAIAGICYGELLESIPNHLADGWRQLGGGRPLEHGQRLSLRDLLAYAPFCLATLGAWKPGLLQRPITTVLFTIIIVGGGVVGVLGVLAYPMLWGYGMRLGVMPFYIATAVLWVWWIRTGGHRLVSGKPTG